MPDASPLDNPEGTSLSQSPKDSKHLSTDSILSTFTLSRLAHPSRISAGAHDKTPSPSARSPQQSPNIQFSSEQSSPTNTMSSKRHPRTPQRPSSYIAPTSVTNLMTSEPTSDSPHTFGHPTPPDKTARFSVPYPSPPPPLPPLDHPELAPPPVNPMSGSTLCDRSNTLPKKRRTPGKDHLFPSLSLKLSHSAQRQPSPIHAQVSSTTVSSPDRRRRARTVSGGARQRRTSADWSSYQASVGVTSHANQAWPAEVSREILRLSLLGQDESQGSSTTHGRNTDPARRPNHGVSSPSFLPFPHPSSPSSPAPLRASPTLTGALISMSFTGHHPILDSHLDGRETVFLPRPHSLQFNLENRRGSELPERSTTTEVKRSLSAIEPRMTPNSRACGAHFASSGLTDPAPTSSGAPHASLAPTPSRSLFSGRVSPTNAPASMQGEPSTPTPEPRHPSDKSRGKRKAEDNLEVTPPEQKKEGQRATFLLPSDSRSEYRSSSVLSHTALSALAQIETKVSASQTPHTLHRPTTANAHACRQRHPSLHLCNRDQHLYMRQFSPQVEITTLRLSQAVPVLPLLLAHLPVLHLLVPASLPPLVPPESMNDVYLYPKLRSLSAPLYRHMHHLSAGRPSSICEIPASPRRSPVTRHGDCDSRPKTNRVHQYKLGAFSLVSCYFLFGG